MERVAYRTALKFGGVPTTHATVFTVRMRVGDARRALGVGQRLDALRQRLVVPVEARAAADTAKAMEVLAQKIARAYTAFDDCAIRSSSPTGSSPRPSGWRTR
jgi:hypothetical protein